MRLVASLRRDPNQACLARIRALQKHQVLEIHIDGFKWDTLALLRLSSINQHVMRKVA
jgi:hypothetical protein